MKKNVKWLSAFVLSGFMLASCASTAHIEKDETIDFSNYKTFAWVDKDGEGNQLKKYWMMAGKDMLRNKQRYVFGTQGKAI